MLPLLNLRTPELVCCRAIAAGIKRGLINYHFGSKAALWEASADHLMSITEQELGAAVKKVETLEESQRLHAFVHAYVTFLSLIHI